MSKKVIRIYTDYPYLSNINAQVEEYLKEEGVIGVDGEILQQDVVLIVEIAKE